MTYKEGIEEMHKLGLPVPQSAYDAAKAEESDLFKYDYYGKPLKEVKK
jgi:hypothetical protein